MATWRAENSMLTKRGIEILNKVKTGIGSITVTRIVASSGRFSESLLSSQTSLSGVTKPMVISHIESRGESGSEISMYITNEGFTESFDLNTIGVFVTHEDYEGEQLYHISQCDADDPDNIPVLGETVTTFGYSIFLEHRNSSSTNITVDLQGMVTINRFNSFTEGLSPSKLVESDSNGNLKSAGKSLSELYNENLLHNWDFRNPVDRKKWHLAIPGTSYYSDSALTNKVGDLTDYFRVNKMDDSYGLITINSVAYYVKWSAVVRGNFDSSITFDRWSILPGSQKSIALIEKGGVLAKLSPNHGRLSQSLTAMTSPTLFAGRTLTATVKVESVTSNSCHLFINDGVSQYGVRITSAGFFKVTAKINDAPTGLNFIVQNTDTENYCDIKISAVKLEIGSISTLENDPPASYTEQMAVCSQYNFQSGEFIGAVPSGYIEDSIPVSTPEDLDRKLDFIIAGMQPFKVKYVVFNFIAIHPILGGSARVFRIDKFSDQYITVQALAYAEESSGVVSEYFRSKYNGVWTAWARTYNTYFKPTPAEIGAAPANLGLGESTGKFSTDLNTTVLGGFYQFGLNTSNTPASYGVVIVLPRGTGGSGGAEYTAQIAIDHQLKMYIRNHRDGGWTSWVQVNTSTVVPATVE